MDKGTLIPELPGRTVSYLTELPLSKGYEVHGIIRTVIIRDCSGVDMIPLRPPSGFVGHFFHLIKRALSIITELLNVSITDISFSL